MLIDDDEPTNYISKILIEEAECTDHIQIVQSGQLALNYLGSNGQFASKDERFPYPNLIFLDINMPAMNGWEFLDRYDKLEQKDKAETVVVMLTTSLNPDDKLKAKEMPLVSGFEDKPLTSEKLNEILRKHFPSYFF